MKTRHIALTMLAGAALMLSACVNENEIEVSDRTLNKDEVAFKMGVLQTRSASKSEELSTVQIGTFNTSRGSFILEDEVESLDGGMATRGTPAFTENVHKLYEGHFNAVATGTKDLPDASYAFDGEEFWSHHFGGMGDLWPEGAEYLFYMRMPADVPGVTGGANGLTYNDDGSIEFDYVSPENATGQKDILFTSKTVKENGESVIFYHALTGVKFSNYYDNKLKDGAKTTVKTIIKEVTFKGLKNSGHCKVTPADGAKSATVAVWSGQEGKATFTQSFTDTTNYKGSKYGLDTLLKAGSTTRNLNDADGSLTFWFIPQDLTKVAGKDSVTIAVKFNVQLDGNNLFPQDSVLTVTLSDILSDSHKNWKAGQLHTFTLKPTAVAIDIDDDLTEYEKSNVVVENKGNVYEYVRVNLIGNWWGNLWKEDSENGPVYEQDSTILFGYMWDSNHEYPDSLTNAWNDKDFTTINADGSLIYKAGYDPYGTFVNLPIKSTTSDPVVNSHNWVRLDKYYYYTEPIGPGSSVTNTLFDSYTVGVSPEFWIPDVFGVRHKAGNVHLIMDLMVQAIECPMKADGKTEASDYMTEWAKALGVSVSDLDDLGVNQ